MNTVLAAGARSATRRAALLLRLRGDALVGPAFLSTLALSAALNVIGLSRNGFANSYYAAAVLAGTKSWKAFFFGSFDAASFITVDKPPASLWLMELSARMFGLSSWSLLLPEALLGVASVAVLILTVRRLAGPVAGILAGLVLALTPVAVLMFRFNNPDALLTFLLVAAAWALVRSLASGRVRWLLLSAALVGLAFNTKYLQAYIVLPALVITYFLFGPDRWLKRLGALLGAAGVLAVSSGWWLAIVDAIPATSRPFIGGSTDNSVLNVVLGYDGFGRVFGALGGLARGAGRVAAGGGPGGGFGAGFGGQPGPLRLFNGELGGDISWLLPLAAVALVAGLWAHRRAPRTDLARAGYVLWGLWLLTHAVVFSFMSGIFHGYYTIAMAPAVAALVGMGAVDLWRLRSRSIAGGALAAGGLLATALWGYQLLSRTPDFAPGLGVAEMGLAVAAAAGLVLPLWRRLPTWLPTAALAVGVVAVLSGPAAYAVATASRAQSGAMPSSGPATATAAFGPGRLGGGFAGRAFGDGLPFPGIQPGSGGGPGQDASSGLLTYLEQHRGSATWLVAVTSAGSGASLELASGQPVLAMGGFSGNDPAMTVSHLTQLIRSGRLRYVMAGGGGTRGGFDGRGFNLPNGELPGAGTFAGLGNGFLGTTGAAAGSDTGSQAVMSWVTQHCQPVDVSGTGSSGSGLYDCSGAG